MTTLSLTLSWCKLFRNISHWRHIISSAVALHWLSSICTNICHSFTRVTSLLCCQSPTLPNSHWIAMCKTQSLTYTTITQTGTHKQIPTFIWISVLSYATFVVISKLLITMWRSLIDGFRIVFTRTSPFSSEEQWL